MKAEVNKLDINNLVNVSASLNNLKTKIDALDVGKLKTFSLDLKELSNILDKQALNNTKFNTIKTKVK